MLRSAGNSEHFDVAAARLSGFGTGTVFLVLDTVEALLAAEGLEATENYILDSLAVCPVVVAVYG